MAVLAGVATGQLIVEVIEHPGGGHGRARVGVGDDVGDRHQHSRRGAVAAYIGEEDAPFATRQREEVIIVATGSLRGLVMGGEV